MLPVTGTFIAPLALYEVILALRVIRLRRQSKTSLGDKRADWSADKALAKRIDPLTVSIRAHANFVEGVPLALLIGAVAEINGANDFYLGCSLALLFVARVLHAEMGLLRGERAVGFGRTFGTAVTQTFILVWGLYGAYLVKGF